MTTIPFTKKILPWADPSKCSACCGIGLVVSEVQSDLYRCGFATVAGTCPVCLGSGRVMPTSLDVKALAAGEVAK